MEVNWRCETIIEIGAGSHDNCQLRNSGATAIRVDLFYAERYDELAYYLKLGKLADFLPDFIAPADNLWFAQNCSVDAVASSQVLEHCLDPVGAIVEWLRVVKDGGYVYVIAPYKDRMFDRERDLTTGLQFSEWHKKTLELKDGLLSKPKFSRNSEGNVDNWFVGYCNHRSTFSVANILILLELVRSHSNRAFTILEANEFAKAPNASNSLDVLLQVAG